MNVFWLLRMKRWAQNPPSWKRIKMVVVILLIIFLIFGFERLFGWPEWLTVDRGVRR